MESVEPDVHPFVNDVCRHPFVDGDPLVNGNAPLVNDELRHHFLFVGRDFSYWIPLRIQQSTLRRCSNRATFSMI